MVNSEVSYTGLTRQRFGESSIWKNQNEPKSESNDRRQGDGQKQVPIFRVHVRGCHGATNGQQGQCSQDHARQENLCKEKHQPDDQQCYGENHFRENKPEGAELQ